MWSLIVWSCIITLFLAVTTTNHALLLKKFAVGQHPRRWFKGSSLPLPRSVTCYSDNNIVEVAPTVVEDTTIIVGSSNKVDFDCFDEAVIFVKGGSGGHGSNTFKFGKGRQHRNPMGGSGGDGGSVIVEADVNMNTLRKFRYNKSFKAANGGDGDIEYANGLKGEDTYIRVPIGTLIYENGTSVLLGEIKDEYSKVVVSPGGSGGRGNAAQLRTRGEKPTGSPPEGGLRRWLRLELKLIADIGLVGVPNAGKSTLLDALTNAKPKIADYAFTTLVPNLGVCYLESDADQAMVLADIPGLIENAHLGKGLGKGFLKHVERCQALIHVVSATSTNPIQEYLTINKELMLYSAALAEKPQIVVLNKIDGLDAEKVDRIMQELKKVMPHSRLLKISAAGRIGLEDLVQRSWMFLQKVRTSSL